MNIKPVYVTSKGMFWDRAEAEKKINRSKEYGSRSGDHVQLESVREEFVLVDGDMAFQLSKVQVK